MANDDLVAHRLYLIRHGETVDNVAGLYAGVRDSALTNHGVQQASRLGAFFSQQSVQLTHVFSSDLQRAVKTADKLCVSQKHSLISTVQVQNLREQDFGYYEGKPYHSRKVDSNKMGKHAHREEHKITPDLKDVESKEDMARRANTFIDEQLMPVLNAADSRSSLAIAVVSHGIFLSTIWRCFLGRQLPNTVTIDSEIAALARPMSLEHLGGWSNTGYLELELTAQFADKIPAETARKTDKYKPIPIGDANDQATAQVGGHGAVSDVDGTEEETHRLNQTRFNVLIKNINSKEHLKGLKRTGGGVGSSRHDEGQKSIKSFFKRRKT